MGVTTRNHSAKIEIKTLGTKKSKKLFAMGEINDYICADKRSDELCKKHSKKVYRCPHCGRCLIKSDSNLQGAEIDVFCKGCREWVQIIITN